MPEIRISTRVPKTANPFHPPPIRYTPLYLLKTALVGVTLFPVRVGVVLTSLVFGSAVAAIASAGANPKSPTPSPVRRALLQPLRLVARVLLWALGYWWIEIEYKPGSNPGGARVLVAGPHYSLLDAWVMTMLHLPCSVAKAAVAKLPIFGKAAVAMDTIFVDRKDPDSKHKCVAAIKERATNPAWPPILLFPEGTCTNGEVLISFKPGAFLPGAPVQPVVLRYPFEHLSVSGASADAEWRLFLSLFCCYNRLRVTYLPEYTPTPDEVADPALFTRNVRQAMADELGVGVTKHSYEDVWLAAKAEKYGVDQTFEVQSVSRLLHISAAGVTQLLERFHALDESGDGMLGVDEFRAALALEQASAAYVARLFGFFDADGSGAISYVEFLQGLALLSPSTSRDEKAKLAFLLCDLDAAGGVTLANLTRVLEMAQAGMNPATADVATATADADAATAADPTAEPPTSPQTPFVARSASRQEAAFAKFDVNNDRRLDFDEFRSFVAANPSILAVSDDVVRGRLAQAGQGELLSQVSSAVAKIKRERSDRAQSVEVKSASPSDGAAQWAAPPPAKPESASKRML